MRLVSFTADHGKPEAGVLSGDSVTSFGTDMLAVLASSGPLVPTGSVYGLKDIRLLAPVPRPPKLICIGLNYLDHARGTGQTVPAVPTVFNKFTNVIIGPGASIALPKASKFPDYEAELAFVVGPGGRNIPASRAMDHVFGYTIFNDVSARDIQSATSQWLLGKTCDTFGPMGPWLVTADEVADPRPWAELIRQATTFHPEFSYLPRKFKIAVIAAKEDRAAIRLHDIGLRLVRNDAGELGFEVYIGGGMGRTPFVAPLIRSFLPTRHLFSYIEAALRVWNR